MRRTLTIKLFIFAVLIFCNKLYADVCNVPAQYIKIQSAIEDQNCDRIIVTPGIYDEQITINRTLTLEGAGENTIIRPTTMSFLYKREPDDSDNTSSIITVTNGETTSTTVTIKNLKIDGSHINSFPTSTDMITGILLQGVSATIESLTIEDLNWIAGTGIYFSSFALDDDLSLTITKNVINRFSHSAITISSYNGSPVPLIEKNLVNGVLPYAPSFYSRFGILVVDSSVEILNNTISDCKDNIAVISYKSGTYNTNIKSNTIHTNGFLNKNIKEIKGINIFTQSDSIINTSIESNNMTIASSGDAISLGLKNNPIYNGIVNAEITGNFIYLTGKKLPLWFHAIWIGMTSSSINITDNIISENIAYGEGVIHIIQGVDTSNITINNNVLTNNRTYSIYNAGSGVLNAEYNWWGSSTGPLSPDNPQGKGDAVYGNIDYYPWLDSPPTFYTVPDIIITSINLPSSIKNLENTKITYILENTGKTAGSANFNISFFISTDIFIDDGEEFCSRNVNPLRSKEKYRETFQVTTSNCGTLPSVTPGIYYIIAKVVTDSEEEINTLNNLEYRKVKIALPDLVIYKLDIPNNSSPGSNITLTYKIKNRGLASSEPFKLNFYLSEDIVFDRNDYPLGEQNIDGISTNEIYTDNFSFEVPSGAWYYLLAVIDKDNILQEINKNNNTGYHIFAIGCDLVVTSLTAPQSAYAGQEITIIDITKNFSLNPTNNTFTINFYLSEDENLDSNDIVLGQRLAPELSGGQKNKGIISVIIPANISPGSYYIIVKVDADNQIAEYKEDNNIKIKPINIY